MTGFGAKESLTLSARSDIVRPPTLAEVQQAKARISLKHFVRYMWPVIEPGTKLKWNWAQDAVCDHLEAITRGQIRFLIINIPPRFLKSTIASVMWPAWSWLINPRQRFLTGSYNKDLAIRDAVRSRQIMQSTHYRILSAGLPAENKWEFSSDQNVKSRYENSQHGHRICTSVDSGATGEGGDIITVDDPHNVMEVESASERRAAIEWWEKTMSSRMNDPKTGAKVVIGQRVHPADLTGVLLDKQRGKGAGSQDKENYTHLCLPQMFEKSHPYTGRQTAIGFADPRTIDGEMLAPDHFDEAAIKAAKRALGPFGFAGQHQQRPSPAEGNIFQIAWFRFWQSLPPRMDKWAFSWDLSFKGLDGKTSFAAESAAIKDRSFVVGDLWGFCGSNAYLIDQVRGQWNIVESINEIHKLREKHPYVTRLIIEDKANGSAVLSLLEDQVPGLHRFEPGNTSKIQRAIACQPFVQAGNVWLPDPSHAPWINDWVDEITQFPFSSKNDRVDTMTQALLVNHANQIRKAPRVRLENLVKP